MTTERIVGAAIRCEGMAFSLEPPARHGDVMQYLVKLNLPDYCHGDQGFVTDRGRFVDRAEAKRIAKAAGQIIRDTSGGSDELYSEDVW